MNKIKNSKSKPQKLSGIPLNLLEAYVSWQDQTKHIPKMLRYSMGIRIDALFSELVELVSMGIFTGPDKKLPFINKANTRNDVLKFMLMALFELNGLKEEACNDLSYKMEEIGRQLYGWKMRIETENQNSSTIVEPLAKDRK
jgi:hypothetical protein